MDRGCRSQRLLWIGGSRKTAHLDQSTCLGQTCSWVNCANAKRRSMCGRRSPTDSIWHTTRRSDLPLLSNILLTPFDKEMRRRGHCLNRYADDWVVSCRSRKEAEKAMIDARRVLATLGVTLNEQKTRIPT